MDRAPESPTNWPEESSDISQGIPTQMDEDNSLRDSPNRLNPKETTTFGRASRHSPNIPEDYHIKFEQVTGGTILNLDCLTNREEMLNTRIRLMDLNIQT